MAAGYREARRYRDIRVEVTDIVEAGKSCHFLEKEIGERSCVFRARFSFRSVGERIATKIVEVDGDCVLDVVSESTLITTIQDWGKNKKNVHELFDTLEHQLGLMSAGEKLLFCATCAAIQTKEAPAPCTRCGSTRRQMQAPGYSDEDQLRQSIKFALIVIPGTIAVYWACRPIAAFLRRWIPLGDAIDIVVLLSLFIVVVFSTAYLLGRRTVR